MKDNKSNVLSCTRYPDSLQHITMDDKDGKTYITDSVFEFFQKVSGVAFQLFSDKNFLEHRQNSLSVAYSAMKSNIYLQNSFQTLMDSICATTSEHPVECLSTEANNICSSTSKSNGEEAMDYMSNTFEMHGSAELQVPSKNECLCNKLESCLDNCDRSRGATLPSMVDLKSVEDFDSVDCFDSGLHNDISIDKDDHSTITLPAEGNGKLNKLSFSVPFECIPYRIN